MSASPPPPLPRWSRVLTPAEPVSRISCYPSRALLTELLNRHQLLTSRLCACCMNGILGVSKCQVKCGVYISSERLEEYPPKVQDLRARDADVRST